MAFRERYTRSLLKALTYRSIILLSDSFIIFFVTKELSTTAKVIILSNIGSTMLYFCHERLWDKVHWGKKKTS